MSAEWPAPGEKPRRRTLQFFLRGLAILLPPILTLVIILWILGGIYDYIIEPTSLAVRFAIAQFIDNSQPTSQFVRDPARLPPLEFADRDYVVSRDLHNELLARIRELQATRTGAGAGINGAGERTLQQFVEQNIEDVYVPYGEWAVPYRDYRRVAEEVRPEAMPGSVTRVYMELVQIRYFPSLFHLSAVAVILVLVCVYFLGRLVTVRVGAWFVNLFETGVLAKLPLISKVYGSVKQVTDFLLTERSVAYSRVVAVQYPSRGLWALAFVTGDGMLSMAEAESEPMVAVLVPTSPMPMTGFTVCVRRSDVLDLDITVDQAFQFIISCGVLVPPHQKITAERLRGLVLEQIEDRKQRLHTEKTATAAGESTASAAAETEGSP